MLIDSHSHINDDKLKEMMPKILEDLEIGKVSRVVCPSCTFEGAKSALQVAKSNDKVFCALGIHPDYCTQFDTEVAKYFTQYATHDKVVAIGEIGLDYHCGYDEVKKNAQFEALNKQIDIAGQFNLPIIFHVRDAFDDFLPWLEKNRHRFCKGVVHCYDADMTSAKKLLDLDMMISFTGIITFKPRQQLREVVSMVPLERMMVETDAPYLAPEPFRGTPNHPQNSYIVAQKVAEIKGVSVEHVCLTTTENAYKFFDKMRLFDEK